MPAEDSKDEPEEDWELDDAAEEADPSMYAEKTEQTANDELLCILAHLPPNPAQRLPCPVIMPQRRPRNKARGFVRAYAPVLGDCEIDQAACLALLNSFDNSSEVRH